MHQEKYSQAKFLAKRNKHKHMKFRQQFKDVIDHVSPELQQYHFFHWLDLQLILDSSYKRKHHKWMLSKVKELLLFGETVANPTEYVAALTA